MGDLANYTDAASNPDLEAAWGRVKNQIIAEGDADIIPGMTQEQYLTWAAKKLTDGFNQAIDSSTVAAQFPAAIKGAESLVQTGATIAGSVGHIVDLLNHGTGSFEQDAQIAEQATGLLIGIAVASGVITAGVGTAIVGAITVVAAVMDQVFGGGPPRGTTSICGGSFPGKPDYAIGQPQFNAGSFEGCMPVYNDTDTHGGYHNSNSRMPGAVVDKGDMEHWRRFPEPNRPQDYRWFNKATDDPGDYFWWDGSASGDGRASLKIVGFDRAGWNPNFVGNEWGTTNVRSHEYGRVCNAWPIYRTLRWCADNDQLNGFNKAFFTAWKANQELNINGLMPASDEDVLAHVAYHWNKAHDGGQVARFSPIGSASIGMQDGYYWRSLIASISGSHPLRGAFIDGGGNLFLNMGPRRTRIIQPQPVPVHLGHIGGAILGSSIHLPSGMFTNKLGGGRAIILIPGLIKAAPKAKQTKASSPLVKATAPYLPAAAGLGAAFYFANPALAAAGVGATLAMKLGGLHTGKPAQHTGLTLSDEADRMIPLTIGSLLAAAAIYIAIRYPIA